MPYPFGNLMLHGLSLFCVPAQGVCSSPSEGPQSRARILGISADRRVRH